MSSTKKIDSSNKLFWLASYPKSGNTWFRIFLMNLFNPDKDLDINQLGFNQFANQRSNFDEINGFCSTDLSVDEINRIRPAGLSWLSQNSDSELYFKTHSAFTFNDLGVPVLGSKTSGTAGALYFVRNPLDVCISYAHHGDISIDRSIDVMADDKFTSHPRNTTHFIPEHLGNWSQHVNSWVNSREIDVHVVRYEDMLARPLETFTGACEFLGVTFDSPSIQESLNQCRFEVLQAKEKNTSFVEKPVRAERFFRKGISGDWRNRLNDKQIEKIVATHGQTMKKFDYLDVNGNPKIR